LKKEKERNRLINDNKEVEEKEEREGNQLILHLVPAHPESQTHT